MLKIFLIDDDPLLNLLNRRIIEKAGFKGQLNIYDDAKKALEVLNNLKKEEFPNLIFLDLNMEPIDGWEFLDELSKLENAVSEPCKVILLSSSIDDIDIDRSKTYKTVCQFISKPITIEQIKSLVNT